LALGYVSGSILDLGCGLANLSLEAGRRGFEVVRVDGSETAVALIQAAAQEEKLRVKPVQADLAGYRIDRGYDTIVAIGLLLFFSKEIALALLEDIQAHVWPAGRAIVNVLTEGTPFLDMFEPGKFYLFGRDELAVCFADWKVLRLRHDTFPAPRNTVSEYATLIAEKGAAG
jgi:tellurite methyltransferase